MKFFKLSVALSVLTFLQISNAFALSPSRVLVVYNASFRQDSDGDGVQDSLEVANYYALKRGVPTSNVLGLACSTSYYYSSYSLLQSEIIQPIRVKLAALGLTNIDVILMCYGTPYLAPDFA